MSNRKLVILGIVTVGMIVWAVVQSNISNRSKGGSAAQINLLQGIEPTEIGTIVVQADGNSITLSKSGGGFVVVEKGNYPAKTSQINNLITSCLDIQTNEAITSNKANFAELGVSDDKPEKAVKFLKTDKGLIAGILIGKTAKDMPGQYVRQPSSDKVYLSLNAPWLQSTAMEYIDRNLTEVKREDIVKISVKAPYGSYSLTNEPNRGAVLANVPAGKRVKPNDLDQVLTALTSLQFDDVKKDAGDMNFDRTYICQLKDSTVYTFNIAAQGSKTFAKCTAEFMDKSEVLKKSTQESDAELKAKEAKLLARDKAVAFAQKTQGWVYVLPEWKAKFMTTKFADLLENEPNKPADANSTK